MIKNLWIKYKEIIMYLIFGVATTGVNWIVYAFAVKVGMNMNLSNCLAWLLAVVFAFVTNKIFVFESKNMNVQVLFMEFIKFIAARVVTGVIEIGGLPVLYSLGIKQSLFGIDGFVAKILVSVIVVILNYVFSKLFIFKNQKDK